jgi:hypothetical protein
VSTQLQLTNISISISISILISISAPSDHVYYEPTPPALHAVRKLLEHATVIKM